MGIRRYPGATPFNSRQANIFYGRDKDIDKLLTLIQVEKKVLLYSKSGLGKTSLLEAGVLPKLPETYTTISIRLFAFKEGAETPVERVINALKSVTGDLDATSDTLIDQVIDNNADEKTLWYYFKKAQILAPKPTDDSPEIIYTLVFDQFEELFTFPKKDIEDFKNQLYELTELKLPDRFAVLISEGRQNNRDLFSRETIGLLHKKIEIKTIFAIRSDRLSLLNNLSDKLPDIQNTFYELLPLDYEQAQQAIVFPAIDNDPVFDTPPFRFHDDAIKKIINELSDGYTDTIETTQLQIVCHRIEEIAAAKEANGVRQITVDDLPEFRNIFLNFYFDSIGRLALEKQDKAKRLIEDELIRNHQRISLDQEICKEYLDEKELRELVDTHLLRAERNTFGRFSYEVSHDTLVNPILESKKKYSDELERLRLEKERQEELRKLKEQQEQEAREREAELKRIREEQALKEAERQRKIKQQRKIILIVSIFLVISLISGAFGYFQRNEARKQEEIAKAAYSNFVKSEFKRNFKEGNELSQVAEWELARERYQVARGFLDSLVVDTVKFNNQVINAEYVKGRILMCDSIIPKKSDHLAIMSEAKVFQDNREYLKAMEKLNQAYELAYDRGGVELDRDNLFEKAMSIYKKDLLDFRDMNDLEFQNKTQFKIDKLNELYKIYDR